MAEKTGIYTLRGDGVEVFEPAFTYRGFRYVEATSTRPESEPLLVLESISALAKALDTPATGHFKCSDYSLSRLWKNAVNT